MGSHEKHPVTADTIDRWRSYRATLRANLAHEPAGADVWLWRVQWDILNFLLHRYAGDDVETLSESLETDGSASPKDLPRAIGMEVNSSSSYVAHPGDSGKMPRASKDMRSFLRQIESENQIRHEFLERDHEEEKRELSIDHHRRLELLKNYRLLEDAMIDHDLPGPWPFVDSLEEFVDLLETLDVDEISKLLEPRTVIHPRGSQEDVD